MSFSNTVKRAWRDNQLMSALIELTYACNLDCVFCYNDLGLAGKPLSLAQYRQLFEELAGLGTLNVALSGGEPLAHPDFYEIGRSARELGFVVRIKSNGHAIKPHVAERIRAEIDPFLIEVSLHGATAETHDRQTRVEGSFDRLLENIAAMRAVGLRVKANSVLTGWNEREVKSLFAMCEDIGVKLQVDTDVKPRDNGDLAPLSLAPSEEGILAYESFLRERALKRGSRQEETTIDAQLEARRDMMQGVDKHCGAGSSAIAVDPFGNVLPCVQWRIPAGNLHEQTLREIWGGSPVLTEVRETTASVPQWLDAQGDTAQLSNYCPGAAHTHSGKPLHLYPAAEARMKRASRERVHLPVM